MTDTWQEQDDAFDHQTVRKAYGAYHSARDTAERSYHVGSDIVKLGGEALSAARAALQNRIRGKTRPGRTRPAFGEWDVNGAGTFGSKGVSKGDPEPEHRSEVRESSLNKQSHQQKSYFPTSEPTGRMNRRTDTNQSRRGSKVDEHRSDRRISRSDPIQHKRLTDTSQYNPRGTARSKPIPTRRGRTIHGEEAIRNGRVEYVINIAREQGEDKLKQCNYPWGCMLGHCDSCNTKKDIRTLAENWVEVHENRYREKLESIGYTVRSRRQLGANPVLNKMLDDIQKLA